MTTGGKKCLFYLSLIDENDANDTNALSHTGSALHRTLSWSHYHIHNISTKP